MSIDEQSEHEAFEAFKDWNAKLFISGVSKLSSPSQENIDAYNYLRKGFIEGFQARASLSSPAMDGGMVGRVASYEYAWVIENKYSDPAVPEYFTSDATWTKDHNEATRFSRQIDAQRYVDHRLNGMQRICEHGWFSEAKAALSALPQQPCSSRTTISEGQENLSINGERQPALSEDEAVEIMARVSWEVFRTHKFALPLVRTINYEEFVWCAEYETPAGIENPWRKLREISLAEYRAAYRALVAAGAVKEK